jgi:hypothetical protein
VFEGWKQQFGLCIQAAIDCGELSEDTDIEQLSEFFTIRLARCNFTRQNAFQHQSPAGFYRYDF